jgi:hypothetical protein
MSQFPMRVSFSLSKVPSQFFDDVVTNNEEISNFWVMKLIVSTKLNSARLIKSAPLINSA